MYVSELQEILKYSVIFSCDSTVIQDLKENKMIVGIHKSNVYYFYSSSVA